jgi:hypothetical protein
MATTRKASRTKAAVKSSALIVSTEPDRTSGSSLQDMEDKALANIVIEGEKKARLSGAALLELRRRFDNLKGKQTILGYRKGQWIKFCNEFLKLSDRQARRLIDLTGEPSPGDKHDGSANRTMKDADGNRITKDGKPFPPPPWTAKTPDGTPVDLARSAAQKAVRDGDEQAGIYWIKQLYFADRKVWKALSIFAVEEIGIADLSVKTHVLELERLAEDCKDERNSDLLHVITAMTICCRAKKCRAADDAAMWYNEHPTFTMPTPQEVENLAKTDLPQPTIDDKVFDRHTTKGRKMGRGMEHFKAEGAQLQNKSNVIPFTPPTDVPCPHCGGSGRVAA